MPVKIELIGANKLMMLLAKAGNQAVPAIMQALTEEGQLIFRESQRIVPVDTGTLRRSGVLLPAKQKGNKIELVMGYGGAAMAYALRQHEDLSIRHKEGKQAKYLETPFRNRLPKLEENLKRRITRILSK
jgi:hypothetical protein